MSGDTPIYDATCRDVGPPPREDRTDAEQTRGADPAMADPVTAELSSPVGDPAPPRHPPTP